MTDDIIRVAGNWVQEAQLRTNNLEVNEENLCPVLDNKCLMMIIIYLP